MKLTRHVQRYMTLAAILVATVSWLSDSALAQRAPRKPRGIFGVRKNALEKPKTYGSERKGIRDNYFGSDPAAKKSRARDNDKSGNESPPPMQAGQAIPESLITGMEKF